MAAFSAIIGPVEYKMDFTIADDRTGKRRVRMSRNHGRNARNPISDSIGRFTSLFPWVSAQRISTMIQSAQKMRDRRDVGRGNFACLARRLREE